MFIGIVSSWSYVYRHRIESILVAVVVVTLNRRCNAVRGHRTGSNNSGVEDYLRRKVNYRFIGIVSSWFHVNRYRIWLISCLSASYRVGYLSVSYGIDFMFDGIVSGWFYVYRYRIESAIGLSVWYGVDFRFIGITSSWFHVYRYRTEFDSRSIPATITNITLTGNASSLSNPRTGDLHDLYDL